jgi:TolB-like protein/DNA-binding SARP family transcriptional activator
MEVDAGVLLALADSTELPHLVQAGELYRGAFLADFELGVEPFDEWVRAERARLETAAARVFEASAESLDRRGDGTAALAMAERLIGLDPLREDWQRLALRLTARYRGGDAAIARAEAFAGLLKSELGVAPAPATLAVIRDIKRGMACAPPQADAAEPAALPLGDSAVRQAAGRGRWRGSWSGPWRGSWGRSSAIAALCLSAVVAIGVAGWRLAIRDHGPAVEMAAAVRPVDPSQMLSARPLGVVPIAVLPFTGDQEEGTEQAIADRITGALIDQISRIPLIRVTSEQTSRLYRGRTVDVAAVGRELGVHFVVEGRVGHDKDRLRVAVGLIDSATRLQIWSDQWERAWADRVSAEDEIARNLAWTLQGRAVGAEARRVPAQGELGVDDLLARGWAAIYRHSMASTTGDAKAWFEEVLRRDPDNLTAMTGLAAADVAAVTNFYVAEREPALTNAEELLRRVIVRSPGSAGAIYWLGLAQRSRGQRDEALRSFARVIELSPSFAPAHAQTGHIEAQMGHPDEGLARIRYAIQLNPHDATVGLWYMFAGQVELERDRLDAAIDWLTRAVALMPRNMRAHASLAAAYALSENMSGAAREVAEFKKLAPESFDRGAGPSIGPGSQGPAWGAGRFSEGWRKALGAS